MDFLKSQLARLQAQFAQLTASQKMLSVALVAIMVMTLTWWGRYAGTADMEPLFDQEVAPDEFRRIEDNLRARGIPFTPSGNRILVPTDRRFEAVAMLSLEQTLPKDISSAFADIVGKMDSPLNTQERSAAIRNEAKQATLASILRYFPKVQNAMVVIDTTHVRSFTAPVSATATVYLKLKAGEKADARMVDAAADVVSGAVAGLMKSKVNVIIDGKSFFSADNTEGGGVAGGAQFERIREREAYYADVVTRQLSFCDGVMVHVNVTSKADAVQMETEQYDPKSTVSKEKENTTDNTSSTTANRPSGDVGVTPNTGTNQGMSIGGAGDEGQSTKAEKTTVSTENKFGKTVKTVNSPAGVMTVASASVTFPRSFFVKTFKTLKGVDKDPSEAVLAPFIQAELDKFRKVVRACLNLPADDSLLAVDTYVDLLPVVVEAPAQASSGVAMMVGSHGKEIALGVLAVASLFMVSTLVRKNAPVPAAAAGGGGGGGGQSIPLGSTVDSILARAAAYKSGGTVDAAEVGEGGQALDGVELDEGTVRAQQVMEQVSTLVKENPDMAASMIKKWMARG